MTTKLLIAEGDWTNLELMTAVLTREGFEIRACRDGLDAYSRFLDFEPEVVLCDEHLPVFTPSEVLQKIRESEIKTHFVLLSTDSEAHQVDELITSIGCDAVLPRPFHYTELLALLKKLNVELPQRVIAMQAIEFAVPKVELRSVGAPSLPTGVISAQRDGEQAPAPTADEQAKLLNIPAMPIPIPLPQLGAPVAVVHPVTPIPATIETAALPIEAEEVPVEPIEAEEIPIEPLEAEEIPIESLEAEEIPIESLEAEEIPIEPLEAEEIPIEPLEAEEIPIEPEPLAAQSISSELPPHIQPGGSLESMPLPRLLFELYVATFSGILHLSRQGLKRTIYLVGGLPTRVDSSQLSENLGQLLVSHGGISAEQYDQAQALRASKGMRQGDALIEIGALSKAELLHALSEQTELKLVNSFSWRDGDYVIEADTSFVDTSVSSEVNPLACIWRGVAEHYEPEALLSYFSASANYFLVATDLFAVHYTTLGPHLRALDIVSLFDGNTTLGAAFTREPGRAGQLAQAFYTLLVTDMMRPSPEPGPALDIPEASPTATASAAQATSDEPTSDLKAFGEAVAQTYLDLTESDAGAVLGLAVDATPAQIDAALAAKIAELGLENLPNGLDDTMRRRARDVHKMLRRAGETLKSPEPSPPASDAPSAPAQAAAPQADPFVAAEQHLAAGNASMESGNTAAAVEYFTAAIHLRDSEPSYRIALGRALLVQSKQDPSMLEAAVACIKQGLALDPAHIEGNLQMAKLLIKREQFEQAGAFLQRVLRRAPENAEARRLAMSMR